MIVLSNCTNDFAGIAHSNRVVGNIFDHDTAAADHHIAANGNAWHHLYSCAYPNIVSNCNGIGIFQALIATFKINRMPCCMKTTIRCNKHVVTKYHFSAIQNDEVVVSVKVFAKFDVISVITPKRCSNAAMFSCFTKKLT